MSPQAARCAPPQTPPVRPPKRTAPRSPPLTTSPPQCSPSTSSHRHRSPPQSLPQRPLTATARLAPPPPTTIATAAASRPPSLTTFHRQHLCLPAANLLTADCHLPSLQAAAAATFLRRLVEGEDGFLPIRAGMAIDETQKQAALSVLDALASDGGQTSFGMFASTPPGPQPPPHPDN